MRTVAANLALGGMLIATCVVGRLMPHPPNFTPLAAAAMFAGFLFGRTAWAAAIPLLSMAISDQFLGSHDWRVMLSVYISLTLPIFFQRVERPSVARLGIGVAASTLLFFFATNFAVWMYAPIYSGDLSGLVKCYLSALPFLKYTLAGDLFYTAAIFGGYQVVVMAMKHGMPTWSKLPAATRGAA